MFLGSGVSSNPLLLILGWVEPHTIEGSLQTAHVARISSTMELSRESQSLCALRALPARRFSHPRCFCCSETDTEAAMRVEAVSELLAKQGS